MCDQYQISKAKKFTMKLKETSLLVVSILQILSRYVSCKEIECGMQVPRGIHLLGDC